MKELLEYLQSIHPLSPDLQEHLSQILQLKVVQKKEYLLKPGQVCNKIYFIEKGMARCFYMKYDKEISSWFMKEGDVIISVESFFSQKPSYECIQAIEDCVLHSMRQDELQYIFRHFPEFNYIARVLTEKYYTLSEQRLYSLRMERAFERYNYLINYHPELVKRVPSTFIASYLGITLETLSRIKHAK
jgi:CRP-like cAMP-binding protein